MRNFYEIVALIGKAIVKIDEAIAAIYEIYDLIFGDGADD